MRSVFSLALAAAVLGASQSASAVRRLSDEDRAVICAASDVVLSTLGGIGEDMGPEAEAQVRRVEDEAGAYTQLPRTIRCGRRKVRMVPRHYGTYMMAFMLSADRRTLVVNGGYQGSVLDGADGYCLFVRSDNEWRNVACRVTGLS